MVRRMRGTSKSRYLFLAFRTTIYFKRKGCYAINAIFVPMSCSVLGYCVHTITYALRLNDASINVEKVFPPTPKMCCGKREKPAKDEGYLKEAD